MQVLQPGSSQNDHCEGGFRVWQIPHRSLLAQALGGVFEDRDAFHSAANISKMEQGIPLVDEDRWPWFESQRQPIVFQRDHTPRYVLACSALKQVYRDRLRGQDGADQLGFVYLKDLIDLIRQRMEGRDHFMASSLLESQFATMEEPLVAGMVEIEAPPEAIVANLASRLLRGGA